MKCLAPVHLMNKYTGRALWVACNKCSHCLENRRNEWLLRLSFELRTTYLGVHCTFQFADEYLGDNVLDKRDLQLLFKRLRKAGLEFSYYGIGEYGTQDRRKHYHVAFFVKNPISFVNFQELILKNWPYGYVYFTHLKRRRLAYILHYHVRPKEVDGKPTFAVFSKGLGGFMLNDTDIRDYCIRNNTICIVNEKGEKQPLPRYYRKKFGYELSETQSKEVKTTLKNIELMAGRPITELSTQQLNKYKATLFYRDFLTRMYKYNNQIKS